MSISKKWRAAKLNEAIKMAKVHVSQITSNDISGLKNDVYGIKNESPIIDELITLLGIPPDRVPIKIRTGFMSYDNENKMLFFSKNKYDQPELLGKRPGAVTESLIDRLEKFAGTKLKPGRNIIKGFPVNLEDNSDGDYLELEAVDKDACTGLVKILRAARFKAKRDGDNGISISEGTNLLNILLDELTEEQNDNLDKLIEKYLDQEKIYNFEGHRGINNFNKVINVLGYSNLNLFFEDNPGSLESIIEWIGTQYNTEWAEALKDQLKNTTNPGNTKDKVRAILIKRGVKEKEADDLIAKYFDMVVKSYSDIKNSPAKIAGKLMLD